MKKQLFVALVTASFALQAETEQPALQTSPSPSHSYAFIDPYQVLESLAQWKDEMKKIETELDKRGKQIMSLEERLKKEAGELQAMGSAASASAKEKKREELLKLQNEIQVKRQSGQEFAERAMQEAQATIMKEIQDAAEKLRRDESLDIIFAGGALAVKNEIDLTSKLTDAMNKKHATRAASVPEKK